MGGGCCYSLFRPPTPPPPSPKAKFEAWLQREKIGREPEEDVAWRRQYFDWYIRWEECDAGEEEEKKNRDHQEETRVAATLYVGCDNLYRQSALSWGEYVDYDDDTSFEDGFDSLLRCMEGGLGPNVEVMLGRVVVKVDSSSGDSVAVTCQDGRSFSAGHVVVTVSLGCLKENHRAMFIPPLPSRTVEAIRA